MYLYFPHLVKSCRNCRQPKLLFFAIFTQVACAYIYGQFYCSCVQNWFTINTPVTSSPWSVILSWHLRTSLGGWRGKCLSGILWGNFCGSKGEIVVSKGDVLSSRLPKLNFCQTCTSLKAKARNSYITHLTGKHMVSSQWTHYLPSHPHQAFTS